MMASGQIKKHAFHSPASVFCVRRPRSVHLSDSNLGVTAINEGLCLLDQWTVGGRNLSSWHWFWCMCVHTITISQKKNSSPILTNLTEKRMEGWLAITALTNQHSYINILYGAFLCNLCFKIIISHPAATLFLRYECRGIPQNGFWIQIKWQRALKGAVSIHKRLASKR